MTGMHEETQETGPGGETVTGGSRVDGRILVVAESDSGGGAGIQAVIKTITALGGYAMTAVTALTAQNTEGVNSRVESTPRFVEKQMAAVLKDIGADVIKVGMVPSVETIESVHYTYMEFAPDIPMVLDPVMIAKEGHALIDREAIHLLKQHFLLHARIATPNIPEAEALTGMEIHSLSDLERVAESMITLGCQSVLVKGGHFDGNTIYDVLYSEDGLEVFEDPLIDTPHTRGTGCTLASAIAVGLAQRMTLRDAVVRARAYVRRAILTAPGFGKGRGPLNHGHTVGSFHPEK